MIGEFPALAIGQPCQPGCWPDPLLDGRAATQVRSSGPRVIRQAGRHRHTAGAAKAETSLTEASVPAAAALNEPAPGLCCLVGPRPAGPARGCPAPRNGLLHGCLPVAHEIPGDSAAISARSRTGLSPADLGRFKPWPRSHSSTSASSPVRGR